MDLRLRTIWVFILLGILAVLNILDYATTSVILAAGGEEVNPIMNFIYQRFGVEYILYSKVFCLGLFFIVFMRYPIHRTHRMIWILSMLILIYVALVIHNFSIVMILS